MPTDSAHLRPGFRTITPYLVSDGAASVIDFLKAAFDAKELLRVPDPQGAIMHAELDIGASIVEVADGGGPYTPRKAAVHIYVPDTDKAYQRAVDSGGTSLYAPVDQVYGDREAGVRDPAGNHWYIATRKDAPGRYIPEGLRNITPYLHARGADKLIEFLTAAFGAKDPEIDKSPDGTIRHAKIGIGDSILELSEAHGEWGPMTAAIHLYVPDADATYRSALAAGAVSIAAPSDAEYGDRSATIADIWGNQWYLATYRLAQGA